MVNPKEKAQELMDKFNLPTGLMSQEIKQCALICVDEILKELESIDDGQTFIPYKYWEQVKKQIEKL